MITTTCWVLLSLGTAVLDDLVLLEETVGVKGKVVVDAVATEVRVDVETRVVELVRTGCSDVVLGDGGKGEVTSSG